MWGGTTTVAVPLVRSGRQWSEHTSPVSGGQGFGFVFDFGFLAIFCPPGCCKVLCITCTAACHVAWGEAWVAVTVPRADTDQSLPQSTLQTLPWTLQVFNRLQVLKQLHQTDSARAIFVEVRGKNLCTSYTTFFPGFSADRCLLRQCAMFTACSGRKINAWSCVYFFDIV